MTINANSMKRVKLYLASIRSNRIENVSAANFS